MKKFLVLLFLMAIGTSVYAQSDNIITEKGYVRGNYYENDHHFTTIDGVLYEAVNKWNSSTESYNEYPNILVKYPQNKNATTYTIPKNTFVIAKGAFQGNKYIQTIRIPSSVAYIGDDAFTDCENLKTIEVYSSSSSSIPVIEEDRETEKEEIGRYNINGVKVEETDDGIQIILYSDGTADKVLKP